MNCDDFLIIYVTSYNQTKRTRVGSANSNIESPSAASLNHVPDNTSPVTVKMPGQPYSVGASQHDGLVFIGDVGNEVVSTFDFDEHVNVGCLEAKSSSPLWQFSPYRCCLDTNEEVRNCYCSITFWSCTEFELFIILFFPRSPNIWPPTDEDQVRIGFYTTEEVGFQNTGPGLASNRGSS